MRYTGHYIIYVIHIYIYIHTHICVCVCAIIAVYILVGLYTFIAVGICLYEVTLHIMIAFYEILGVFRKACALTSLTKCRWPSSKTSRAGYHT